MRTDYFDDLLPDIVTRVTQPEIGRVTPAAPEKPRNHADSDPASRMSRTSRSTTDATVKRTERPTLFEYVLADDPAAWLALICPPGSDLDHARRRLEHQFGADRVIDVRDRRSTEGDHG